MAEGGAERPAWLRPAGDGSRLLIHVQPGAARSAVAGPHGDALKVRVAAPPVEGEANAALVTFIAGWLEVSRGEVTIERGDKSRRKLIRVALSPEEIERRLIKEQA